MKLFIVCALLSVTSFAFANENFTLSGRYEYKTDSESLEMLDGLVCFYPDADSAKLLPRLKTDKRLAWVCFKNKEQSKKLLAIPVQNSTENCGFSGTANIRVNGYKVYLGEGDGFDTARLQSVISHSKLKVISCN